MSKADSYKQLRVSSVEDWREWLKKHFSKEGGIWLVFKKKGAGAVPFDYQMALDEALCYGWVDSLLKSVDEREYMRKFTPRKASSTWSEHNKKHVARLIREGRMKDAGMKTIEVAKAKGMWDKGIKPPEVNDQLPGALLSAFQEHRDARYTYFNMPLTHQKQYNIWINMAKRAETVRKRVEESIRLLEQGKELGLK
ncbi:MAG: YdeI/OmpD-associated family protein [Bacteroidota bacterium]